MNETLEFVVRTVLIGVGATVVMDLWALFLKSAFNAPSLDYALVGRWIGHFRHGKFMHESIHAAAPVRGEGVLGWSVHYLLGIAYAALLLAIEGLEWARHPTLLPALVIAWVLLIAPYFIMQPGLGAGIAGAKTPKPNVTRVRSALTHTVFGIGMYVSALLSAQLIA